MIKRKTAIATEFALTPHAVCVKPKASSGTTAMLSPNDKEMRSRPERSDFRGNDAASKAYPGTNRRRAVSMTERTLLLLSCGTTTNARPRALTINTTRRSAPKMRAAAFVTFEMLAVMVGILEATMRVRISPLAFDFLYPRQLRFRLEKLVILALRFLIR